MTSGIYLSQTGQRLLQNQHFAVRTLSWSPIDSKDQLGETSANLLLPLMCTPRIQGLARIQHLAWHFGISHHDIVACFQVSLGTSIKVVISSGHVSVGLLHVVDYIRPVYANMYNNLTLCVLLQSTHLVNTHITHSACGSTQYMNA